jgi:hypothetical protein
MCQQGIVNVIILNFHSNIEQYCQLMLLIQNDHLNQNLCQNVFQNRELKPYQMRFIY